MRCRLTCPPLVGGLDAPGYLPELVVAKTEREHGTPVVDHARLAADVQRLRAVLDEVQASSALPEMPTVFDALHDFVVQVRLTG